MTTGPLSGSDTNAWIGWLGVLLAVGCCFLIVKIDLFLMSHRNVIIGFKRLGLVILGLLALVLATILLGPLIVRELKILVTGALYLAGAIFCGWLLIKVVCFTVGWVSEGFRGKIKDSPKCQKERKKEEGIKSLVD